MDLNIHAAYFSTHAEYQQGNTYLLFLVGSDENGDPQEIRMSVGADWTSSDGGKTITHPTKRKVNKNSIYGHWIEAAWQCEEVVDGKRLRDVLAERGNGWEADVWTNVRVHLDLTEIKFGRNLDPQHRLMPTHYLGIDTGEATLTTPAQPATVAPTVSEPSAPASPNGRSPLFQEMVDLARASSTFPEFQKAAFARDEVLLDEELAEQVADKQGGIWPLAKA
jgi:hypothetical protein